jgi:hypothetical protein
MIPPYELRLFAPSARFTITGDYTKFSKEPCLCELGKQSTCLLTVYNKNGFALSRTTMAEGTHDLS